jgi:hypothetical protein
MSKHVQLNGVEHGNLRVITQKAAEFGDNVMCASTFPAEFRSLQARYPIVFSKSSDNHFLPVALLGFEKDENLFLTESGWDASYIPLTIDCQPFLIGLAQRNDVGGEPEQPMVHIDMDSPRISYSEGESLFLEHGGYSPYLTRISSMLAFIHNGYQRVAPFITALTQHDLIEPFSADITLNDGSKNRLTGFYTIHEERLKMLRGDDLAALNEQGFLEPIYMQLASLSQFQGLIDRKNLKL